MCVCGGGEGKLRKDPNIQNLETNINIELKGCEFSALLASAENLEVHFYSIRRVLEESFCAACGRNGRFVKKLYTLLTHD